MDDHDGGIFSIQERQTRERAFFSLLEKKLSVKRGETSHSRILFQRISQLSSSDENAPILAEIEQAFLKKKGYLRRFFSYELLSEWPEHHTHLGKVFSRFSDCMESTIPVRRLFRSLTREELKKADAEAFALLKKMEYPPPSLEPTFLPKRIRPLPSLPSAIFAYSFMHQHPQAIPAIFLWGVLSQIQQSASVSCTHSSIEIGEGYLSRVPIAISGTKVFFPSNTSSFIRVFDTSDPRKAVEMEPIHAFPNELIADIVASESHLAVWQPADPTKIHFVPLQYKIPEKPTEEIFFNNFWFGIIIGGVANLLITMPLHFYLFIARHKEKKFLSTIMQSPSIGKVPHPESLESYDSQRTEEEETEEIPIDRDEGIRGG
ncbi:MAG: hypothetical protein KR126chlam3_00350 [Chlamydiae bacterium]|nr:hypothetical protein [Chlamydiota bacterium]